MGKGIRRLLIACLAGLILLPLLGGGALYWLGKRAEPVYDGTLVLAGLDAPVRVRFGPHAVPSIEAASLDDMLFAQGYVVAAERFWQMDLMRRLAGGRLAEVFGEQALVADRYYRTIGLPLAAREAYAALEPDYRWMLDRFSDGVNAYLDQSRGRAPLEYLIAGFERQPWQPQDSLVIGEYMAWINSVNLREELAFLRLAGRLGNALALELFPADLGIPAPDRPEDLPDYAAVSPPPTAVAAADHGLGPLADAGPPIPLLTGGASNVWSINGPRSAGAAALLANDPHLAPGMPGVWYELEMQSPGYQVAGVALPGVPFVLIGHNADLAWGLTTVTADTQDLFIERISDDGNGVVRSDGRVEPIQRRREQIAVKGRASPEELVIESTGNGVLIDQLVGLGGANPEGLARIGLDGPLSGRLALRRNMDMPERALVALWRLNRADSVDAARAAGADLRHVSQNLVIAHRDGSIGWQVTGLLPRRGRGSGVFPLPGWEPGYGWTGYLPFEQNPGITNPPDHQLVNANNRSVPADAPVAVGHSWLPPYRAMRIEELLDTGQALDAAALGRMQADRESVRARVFIESLRRALPRLRQLDTEAAQIAEVGLLSWRGDFDPASRDAALFGLLLPALYRAVYADELGADLAVLMSLDGNNYGPLDEALRTDRSSFFDDIGTPLSVEGVADVWARALRDADAALRQALPRDAHQRLDRLRSLTFPHAFDGQPVLGGLFNVGPIGMGGDSATINVANASSLRPREVGYIPSMRVVYTPGNWGETRGGLPLGQSGHRFSAYRTDQLDSWLAATGGHVWPWNGPAQGKAIGELTLLPAPAP
jgi:acyl-homoserine lactone acylase PvdQ